MRITGGHSKGRVLASPRGSRIRPSSDQIREAIFNLIGQDLTGIRVLDLFGGSGSLGLEALSRGALCAVFIDHSQQAVNLIKKNITLCGCENQAFVIKKDLRIGIPWKHPFMGDNFDLVFLDPPYGKDFIPSSLHALASNRGLSQNATVLAESGKTEKLPALLGGLKMVKFRIYGDTKISIYNYEGSE